MSPDPTPVRATLVLPSTRTEGLAKVRDQNGDLTTLSHPQSDGLCWREALSLKCFPLVVSACSSVCIQKPET